MILDGIPILAEGAEVVFCDGWEDQILVDPELLEIAEGMIDPATLERIRRSNS